METKTDDETVVMLTAEELHAEAHDLSDKLGQLFNGHSKDAIAAAMWGVIGTDRDIAKLIGEFSVARVIDKLSNAEPCDDPTCAACMAKKAKRGQA